MNQRSPSRYEQKLVVHVQTISFIPLEGQGGMSSILPIFRDSRHKLCGKVLVNLVLLKHSVAVAVGLKPVNMAVRPRKS